MMTDVDPTAAVVWPKWCYSVLKKAGKPNSLPISERIKSSDGGPSARRRRKVAPADGGTRSRQEGAESGCRSVTPDTPPSGSGSSSPTASSCSDIVPPLTPLTAPTVTSYSDLMRQLAAKYNTPSSISSPLATTTTAAAASAFGPFQRLTQASCAVSCAASAYDTSSLFGDKLRVASSSLDQLHSTALLGAAAPLPFTCFSSHLSAFSRLPMLDLMRRSSMSTSLAAGSLKEVSPLAIGAGGADSDITITELGPPAESRKRSRSPDPARNPPPVSTPLDLSAIKSKRRRSDSMDPDSPQGETVTPPDPALSTGCVADSQSRDQSAVTSWSVAQVVQFVESVEDCAEYAALFAEHRISGRALSLLRAEYLTNILGVKLGPALHFCAALSNRLGLCAVCSHCSHCHQAGGGGGGGGTPHSNRHAAWSHSSCSTPSSSSVSLAVSQCPASSAEDRTHTAAAARNCGHVVTAAGSTDTGSTTLPVSLPSRASTVAVYGTST